VKFNDGTLFDLLMKETKPELRRQRVDGAQVAVVVPVPVDPHVAPRLLDDRAGEPDHRPRAGRRGVADGVGNAHAGGA
jgi:hypothetical protein